MKKQKINTKRQKTKKNEQQSTDFLQKIDNYLEPKMNIIFWALFIVSLLFTFLLLNLQVSVGGDDSQYIIRAYDFIKEFKYPAFQGPLYPMCLGVFVGVFGVNLFVLKMVSAIFMAMQLWLFYKVFKEHISSLVMLAVLLVLSINANILFYGGQTYSEAMFLFVQMLFILYFFKHFIAKTIETATTKQQLVKHLVLGSIILALGLVKSIGYAAFFAVIAYFLLEKRWKSVAYSIVGFFTAFGLWKLIKIILWHSSSLQFGSQAATLLQKNPYNASQGQETLWGFLERFAHNTNAYLSRQFLHILDFRDLSKVANGAIITLPPVLWFAIIVVALIIYTFIVSLKSNKFLKFTVIYLSMVMGITFVILQTIWEGPRLMIVFFPLLILVLYSGIYHLFKIKKLRIIQFLLPLLIFVVFLTNFKTTVVKIKGNQKIFARHLRGDITAGMSQDWRNYVRMCKWSAKNVAKDKKIACRKPGIAFIYTGRRFHGIYNVPTKNPDTLVNNLYKRKIDYIVMANLRKYEASKTKYTINTILRYLYFIQAKYPNIVSGVQQVGSDEQAFLYKVNYPEHIVVNE